MELSGTDEDFIIQDFTENLLGNNALGLNPLGSILTEDDESPNPNGLDKFRVYFPLPKTPFYELSLEVSSNQAGSQWELLRFAYDAEATSETYTKLKKSL